MLDWTNGRPGPVFVGGTGRSGTTITGALIGAHPAFAVIPSEFRFHVNAGGIPGLLAGKTSLASFVSVFQRRVDAQIEGWPESVDRAEGLLWRCIHVHEVEEELARLVADFERDRIEAARAFVEGLFGGVARRQGKPSWVEMSLLNVAAAPVLIGLFPNAKIIHSVRDGRDVACSRLARYGQPAGTVLAVRWMEQWASVIEQSDSGVRCLPSSRAGVVRFERLVEDRREPTLRALLRFLGVEEEPEIRAYFQEQFRPERANIGRWARDVPADERESVAKAYDAILSRLRAQGLSPALLEALAEVSKPGHAASATPGGGELRVLDASPT